MRLDQAVRQQVQLEVGLRRAGQRGVFGEQGDHQRLLAFGQAGEQGGLLAVDTFQRFGQIAGLAVVDRNGLVAALVGEFSTTLATSSLLGLSSGWA